MSTSEFTDAADSSGRLTVRGKSKRYGREEVLESHVWNQEEDSESALTDLCGWRLPLYLFSQLSGAPYLL